MQIDALWIGRIRAGRCCADAAWSPSRNLEPTAVEPDERHLVGHLLSGDRRQLARSADRRVGFARTARESVRLDRLHDASDVLIRAMQTIDDPAAQARSIYVLPCLLCFGCVATIRRASTAFARSHNWGVVAAVDGVSMVDERPRLPSPLPDGADGGNAGREGNPSGTYS
jgi:hypothetical protein